MTVGVNKLSHRFDDGSLGLDEINLVLDDSGFTVMTGANGSGKTLLIRHILGLESPSQGEITFNGQGIAKNLKELRSSIALVFQEPEHQILGLTVREDLEVSLKPRKLPAAEKAAIFAECLELGGLKGLEDRLCTFLSGGEKRRLAMASALAQGAGILIMDEPFNDLDWEGAHQVLTLILKLKARGMGIWLVTHDLEKCLAHADRLIVMHKGRIRGDGHPDSLWDQLPSWGIRRPAGTCALRSGMTWLMPDSMQPDLQPDGQGKPDR